MHPPLPFLMIILPSISSLSLSLNRDYPPYGCQNYGDCNKLSGFAPMQCAEGSCVCNNGYSGTWCEIDLNITACDPNPCSGDRVCEEAGLSLYRCVCAPGFNGPDCIKEVSDPCAAYLPCGDGNNTCMNDPSEARGYTCACTGEQYYSGADCTTKNYCYEDSDCFYGAACQDNNQCMCTDMSGGKSCSTYTVCALVKGIPDYGCLNGGSCSQL